MSTLAIETESETEAAKKPNEAEGQYVTFASGGVAYGVEIMAVREIRSWSPTTPLPQRGSAAKGVLDVRGTVIEVFDLAGLLGGMGREPDSGSVVLVLALDDRTVGILVDSVSDIIQAQPKDLMAVPKQRLASPGGSMIAAMVNNDDRLIGILALEKLFPPAEDW